MSCIRYKFKTALEYDKVTFDGLQISVSELREKIMSLKKMNLSDNLTLDIMDAQTKKSEWRGVMVVMVCNWKGERNLIVLLFDLICYLFPLVSVYSNDSVMIPRNSTVVVMRVPKPQKPSTQLVYICTCTLYLLPSLPPLVSRIKSHQVLVSLFISIIIISLGQLSTLSGRIKTGK